MKAKNKILTSLLLAGLSLPVYAGHVPGFSFAAEPFTFNPTAFCDASAPCSAFTSSYIDFSYESEVDQTLNTFTETGVGFFGTFRDTLASPPEVGTGLGSAYQMYAVFNGAGTTAANLAGGIDGTFNSFNVSFYIDNNMDTTGNTFTTGIGGGNESKTVAGNTADDVLILTGVLDTGGFHVFGGLAAGDFDVLFRVTSYNNTVWGGQAFSGSLIQGDLNGVNTQVSGVAPPPVSFVDGRIIGSGNASFRVPEPASMSLLGLGLVGMGALLRRKRKAHAA